MDREMLLFQARQDFIDMHVDLYRGSRLTLEQYDRIARDMQTMDELNFEQLLSFTEKTEGIPLRRMWQQISTRIAEVKKEGRWREQKQLRLQWHEGDVSIRGADDGGRD